VTSAKSITWLGCVFPSALSSGFVLQSRIEK